MSFSEFSSSSFNESLELGNDDEFVSAALSGGLVFFFNSGAKNVGVVKEGLVALELVGSGLGNSSL